MIDHDTKQNEIRVLMEANTQLSQSIIQKNNSIKSNSIGNLESV